MKQFSFVPEVFSIDAAAHYLGVSKRTVEEYLHKGMIHAIALPHSDNDGTYLHRTLIRKRELDKFIESGVSL